MIKKSATRRRIAVFFLCLLFVETVLPLQTWALTSGPAQPETRQFAPAGTSDMVDLFTGDFKYNIPLLDVDGYPVNLNYASGVGMDDEASWVGLGWNLNVGAVNRQLRGIADDASGDSVVTESYMKPKITVGGRVTARVEVAGWETLGFNGSVSMGIFSDNYLGYGADVGVGTGASFGLSVSGSQTAGLAFRAGISMNSSTQDGVTLSPSLSASVKKDIADKSSVSAGLSANLGYNTREGLKNTTLGMSFVPSSKSESAFYSTSHSNTSYNTPPFYPRTATAFKTVSNSYGFDIGGSATLVYLAGGLVGYKTTREILNNITTNHAYGFMYAERGKHRPTALMDFMREKDNPVIPSLPNLAIPVATPDIFSYSGQAGSGQFRLYRGSSGTLADASAEDLTSIGSISAEYGFGSYFHGGLTFTNQGVTNKTGKWRNNNDFLAKGDYPGPGAATEEPAYFKMVGEKNMDDQTFYQAVQGADAVRVALNGKKLTGQLSYNNTRYQPGQPEHLLRKNGRQLRRTPILALTSREATLIGLDRKIKSYPFNNYAGFPINVTNIPQQQTVTEISREDNIYRKAHHISEFTIQADNGSRMVYGLPVYNTEQEEYTFSVDPAGMTQTDKDRNQVRYTFNPTSKKIFHKHAKTDHYYRRETQPAYTTAHLLTGVLSPDYVDVTGDGISDDDPGTAVKFNYSKVGGVYNWRSPYIQGATGSSSYAQYNKGLLADGSDDKGNIVFGRKELWYLHSIESKTKIAYFITEDRDDALGVADVHGAQASGVRQKRLREIRIYSKTDMTRPIKTVVFEYDYALCTGAPNTVGTGKLRLKKVYFKYNNNNKGIYHPYTFEYASNPGYQYMSVDRWGSYKENGSNAADGFPDMRNDEFPYAARGTAADEDAAAWHLSKIILPSRGEINVQYEADDYAWVQDRRAMQMMRIEGLIKDIGGEATTSLGEARGFRMALPHGPENNTDPVLVKEWFVRNYLSGKPYLYAKLFVNLSDQPASTDQQYYDYVPCYGEIEHIRYEAGFAYVIFKTSTFGGQTANPFQFAAWQKMRLEYPCYAYPGFRNRIDDNRPVAAAVSALGNAISNFGELRMNFNKRAAKKGFASKVDLGKSFARLSCYKTDKKGGGSRVKQIRIEDKWDAMAQGGVAAVYGQSYDYTIAENGVSVSSGVASYEPAIGGDENPMRMPVPYSQEFHWALTNEFYLEEPMGESLFPAPQVGYRKVTIKNLDDQGIPSDKMGSTVHEFYTAKEFPVEVTQTDAEKVESETKRWFPFFGGDYAHEVYMSQGYVVHLNDMHGKPFREKVLNQNGEDISSVEYRYRASYDEFNGRYRLSNDGVPVVWEYMKVNNGAMGREVEVFTDLREQETASTNKIFNAGVDVIPFFFGFPTPFPHIPLGKNNDYKLFRSASLLKTVHDYGILGEIVKTVNGSTITTTNELFDQETGDVIMTRTQNEFEDPVYTINIPAYYAHKGMGLAYQTLGMVIPGFQTSSRGEITSAISEVLQPGDELVDLGNGNRSWVVLSTDDQTGYPEKRLIDPVGRIRSNYTGDVKVYRSGYRNVLTAGGASFVTLKKPNAYLFDFFSGYNTEDFPMLDAKATLYHEAWGRPSDCNLKSCPEGYNESDDGTKCMWVAENNTSANWNVVAGSQYSRYGEDHTRFSDILVSDQLLNTGYWAGGANGRLNACGIWLNNHETQGEWWGVETCFELTGPGPYYLGVAADNNVVVYVDGFRVINFDYGSEEWIWKTWTIRNLITSEGRHTIRIEARNQVASGENPRSVGVEVYSASRDLMLSGSASIGATRVFSTEWLRDNNTVSTYKISGPDGTRTSSKYTCPTGKTLSSPCDGTPNCGYKEKGDCPDGYTKSPDGQSCYPVVTTDNSPDLAMQSAQDSIDYDRYGGILYDAISPTGQQLDTTFFSGGIKRICNLAFSANGKSSTSALLSDSYCGRLNASGIRLAGSYGGPSTATGFTSCFEIPQTKTYYLGFSGSRSVKIYIDDVLFKSRLETNAWERWHVYPVDLAAGSHTIRVEAQGVAANEIPIMGVEIYDCTRSQLISSSYLQVIWSTLWPVYYGGSYNSFVRSGSTQAIVTAQTLCGTTGLPDACTGCQPIPNGPVINPYVTGYLGNWTSWKDYVYMDSRTDNGVFNPNATSLNIRKSGTYIMGTPFYYKQSYGGYDPRQHSGSIPGWVVAREVTLQDRNMQELENKDALGRYSAARYGYRGVLPVAVASNARHREIFYDGFEDYKFFNHSMAKPFCDVGDFDIRKTLGDGYASRLEENDAHSGRYSLKLSSPITLSTWQFSDEHTPGIYLSNNHNGELYRSIAPWLGLWGFAPMNAKQYVFSAWVKDGNPLNDATGITVALNGGTAVSLSRQATVEGWKLVEGTLTIPAGSPPQLNPVSLTISGGANILIDDIRIFPFDAQVKTYSYDDRTLRLMGEMDENNYATFYEYDDEGALVRVKKETERGIITIKESRTSYYKKTL